jgi:hypothetical protein
MIQGIKNVLKSTRFWAITGISVVGYLNALGLLTDAPTQAIIVILGAYTAVKTSQDFQYPQQ